VCAAILQIHPKHCTPRQQWQKSQCYPGPGSIIRTFSLPPLFIYLAVLGFELRATPPALFFVKGSSVFFCEGVSRTICLGWLWTTILLISPSWVTRITGESHWHPVLIFYFKANKQSIAVTEQFSSKKLSLEIWHWRQFWTVTLNRENVKTGWLTYLEEGPSLIHLENYREKEKVNTEF
jgi:hypothetical protein